MTADISRRALLVGAVVTATILPVVSAPASVTFGTTEFTIRDDSGVVLWRAQIGMKGQFTPPLLGPVNVLA